MKLLGLEDIIVAENLRTGAVDIISRIDGEQIALIVNHKVWWKKKEICNAKVWAYAEELA